jgi:hypothetical protein
LNLTGQTHDTFVDFGIDCERAQVPVEWVHRFELLRHLRADVLKTVADLDFMRDGYAVLVTVGVPPAGSISTLRPRGPRVSRTAFAKTATPFSPYADARTPGARS